MSLPPLQLALPPARLEPPQVQQENLKPEVVELLCRQYGQRASRAVDAVRHGRVKRYNDFWVVVGSKGEQYVVELDGDDGFCLCKDWLIRRSAKHDICYHMLAARIARDYVMYVSVDDWAYNILLKRNYLDTGSQ